MFISQGDLTRAPSAKGFLFRIYNPTNLKHFS